MLMDEGGNPTNPCNSNDSTSAGDLAWAESCLVKLSEASDADWRSFELSMLEILNAPTEPVKLLTNEDGNFGDNHPFPSEETIKTPMLTDEGSDSPNDDDEDSQDDTIDNTIHKKKKRWLKGEIVSDESPLLPGHAEFLEVESSDAGFDFGPSFEHETTSSQEIFRVWDLGVSDEQDEFTEKLNEALEESTVASNSDVTGSRLDFAIQSVDDLIAGISELSLGESSI